MCYVYIVLFLALLSFGVPFCSASRSVFIGWLDCQSSFWRHDVCQSAGVPAAFEDASWLCVCAPCQRTLCTNTVSSLCSTPIVYRCLMYLLSWVMLCVVRYDLFIDLFLVYWLVSNSVLKITLMPVLEFQSYYVKFKVKCMLVHRVSLYFVRLGLSVTPPLYFCLLIIWV